MATGVAMAVLVISVTFGEEAIWAVGVAVEETVTGEAFAIVWTSVFPATGAVSGTASTFGAGAAVAPVLLSFTLMFALAFPVLAALTFAALAAALTTGALITGDLDEAAELRLVRVAVVRAADLLAELFAAPFLAELAEVLAVADFAA